MPGGLLITERQEWLEKLFEEIEELCQEETAMIQPLLH